MTVIQQKEVIVHIKWTQNLFTFDLAQSRRAIATITIQRKILVIDK